MDKFLGRWGGRGAGWNIFEVHKKIMEHIILK